MNLFIDVVCYLGFVVRFVSGYVYIEDEYYFLGMIYVWVEVFIFGVGWKGFDLIYGCLVGVNYIVVVVSRFFELVFVVFGVFWGLLGLSLKVDVWVMEIG